MQENRNTEFKREYVEDIKKTVIAFANTEGGKIIIGIDDNGSICGVEDVDGTMLKITNAIRDSVKPDVSMFVNVYPQAKENKNTVVVDVQRGTAQPYYLAGKGIRPEGVYVRQGASSAPATETAILNMIRETAGDSYEQARSINQNLTFEVCKRFFANEKLEFGEKQKKTLRFLGTDDNYTNLALLLSDQCNHTIKTAVFQGTKKTTFKDRKEFAGSLLKQLEDAYSFIDMLNPTSSEFQGLMRIDKRSYPVEALREALLNSIVHREYSFSASTLISIFDDRIEFVTIGGLIKGVTESDIMLGVSVLRNRNLADIFYRLHLIEAYGTGIPKIKEAYAEYECEPLFEISDNAFKITLPNTSYSRKREINAESVSVRELRVIEFLKDKGEASRPQVQKHLKCSQTTAITLLGEMANKDILQKIGNGPKTKYKLK